MAAALAPPTVGGAIWFAAAGDARALMLAHALYWTMPVVLALWLVALILRLRAGPMGAAAWLRTHAAGLAVALLATIVVLSVVPASMRMQFDETSLLGTSQSMHSHRLAMMTTGAVPTVGDPAAIDWNLDKRPPLFPFLVSLLHDLRGYRIANAFAVNAAVLFLLLAQIACVTRRSLGAISAMAAPLLVLAVPLVVVTATSAGFELLAALLLATVVIAAIDTLAQPTAVRATWLLANGLLFAQARYESLFVLVALALVLAWRRRPWPLNVTGRWLLLASPTLLLPIALLLVHSRNPDFYVESGGQSLVSLAHFFSHGLPFLGAYFAPVDDSALPGGLGIVSFVALVLWFAKGRCGASTICVLVPVAVATAIVLAWFYGDVNEPTALRLFLPVAVLGALGPLLLPVMFPARWLPVALLVIGTAGAGWRTHAVVTERVMPPYFAAVALEAVEAALQHVKPDPHRTLLVSTVAQYLIVRGWPAMSPIAFRNRARGATFAEVLVLETPLDAKHLRHLGDPRDVLRDGRATLLGRIEGDLPVAVHRLER